MNRMKENYIAFQTILIKEVTRFIRIWSQTIVPPAITMTLYFVIFGGLIGKRVGQMGGFDYMQYIAPGLIMMSVITSSYANVVSSFFSSKFQRSIEELLVSPTPSAIVLLGFTLGGVVRGLLVGLMVTVVALFFTHLTIHHVLIMLSVVFLSAFLFSLAGLINGIFAKKFDDVNIIPVFVLTPLTYLGGVFYSISLLPSFWEHASRLNPILYMVSGFRYGMLGVSDINVVHAILVLLLFIVLLFGWAMWLLEKGVGIRT